MKKQTKVFTNDENSYIIGQPRQREVWQMDWKRKLTSRKLWASVASFTSMLLIYFGCAESEASKIAALIMAAASMIGYVIGEGLADSSDATIDTSKDKGDGEK